jgi:hypothetical protein
VLPPLHPKQLRRLHALWRRWTSRLALSPEQDRRLRHYYVWLLTRYQCSQTKALSQPQAARVIEWLARRVRQREARRDYAAGTAGRQGYPEQRRVPPSAAAWRALWGCAAALGMSRADLDSFIRHRYGRAGLRGIADLRAMADLNRVLWGLKAMLRHREKDAGRSDPQQQRAA